MRFQVIAAAWYLLGVERVDHCWRQVCANETALDCSTAFFDCTSATDPALRGVRASWAANTQVVTQCVNNSMQPGGYFNYGEEARGSPPRKPLHLRLAGWLFSYFGRSVASFLPELSVLIQIGLTFWKLPNESIEIGTERANLGRWVAVVECRSALPEIVEGNFKGSGSG